MTSVDLNKKNVMRLVGRAMSDEQIEDRLSFMGAPAEGITDEIIHIDITPNRPDLLSDEGVARALKQFLGLEYGLRQYKTAEKPGYKAHLEKDAERVRPYVACAVIEGVDVNETFLRSMMQIQEKLHLTHSRNRKKASIGIYDADTIKFPLTYKTVDERFSFVPLDFEKPMTIKEILTKHPKGTSFAHLAPGPRYVVWVDSKQQVLSFPPIINSAETAVTNDTKNLFIDVTGTDRDTVEAALNMIVTSMADEGGKIHTVDIDGRKTPDLTPRKMAVRSEYVEKLLGLELTPAQMKECLERMGYSAETKGNDINVLIPAWRPDVMHPADLAEDIAIAYGYDKIESSIPHISTIGQESPRTVFKRNIGNVCAGLGLLGCCDYHLTNEDVLFTKMNAEPHPVCRTTNALNINYTVVRDRLLPGLMRILSENKHYDYPQKLFEVGEVVIRTGNKIHEEDWLAAVSCHASADFAEAKAMCEALFRDIGETCQFRTTRNASFVAGRCAEIVYNGKPIGLVGEVNPQVLNNFALELPVCAFELSLETIRKKS